MLVYSAAGLLQFVSEGVPVYIVDPGSPRYRQSPDIHVIREKASVGVKELKRVLPENGG